MLLHVAAHPLHWALFAVFGGPTASGERLVHHIKIVETHAHVAPQALIDRVLVLLPHVIDIARVVLRSLEPYAAAAKQCSAQLVGVFERCTICAPCVVSSPVQLAKEVPNLIHGLEESSYSTPKSLLQ